jgi:hypothetical protein
MFGFVGGKILIVLPLKGNKDFISLRQSYTFSRAEWVYISK